MKPYIDTNILACLNIIRQACVESNLGSLGCILFEQRLKIRSGVRVSTATIKGPFGKVNLQRCPFGPVVLTPTKVPTSEGLVKQGVDVQFTFSWWMETFGKLFKQYDEIWSAARTQLFSCLGHDDRRVRFCSLYFGITHLRVSVAARRWYYSQSIPLWTVVAKSYCCR